MTDIPVPCNLCRNRISFNISNLDISYKEFINVTILKNLQRTPWHTKIQKCKRVRENWNQFGITKEREKEKNRLNNIIFMTLHSLLTL